MTGKKIHLGAFMTAPGQHSYAWRHPDVTPDFGENLEAYVEAALTAERGLFDLMFLADNAGVWDRELQSGGKAGTIVHFEPITLLAALAARTTHLGLVATQTTSFSAPYTIARQYASLDHLSGGRAGWNVVTSMNEAEAYNFGLDTHYGHAERYRMAEEFVGVVLGLWDSYEDDTFVRDKESGVFFDPEKVHVLGHQGEFYRVRGPLNVSRSPQGRPVIVQAGSSPAGIALAGRVADVIFTAQNNLDGARAFYARAKEAAAAHGREADSVAVMPGLFPIVGRSQAEAEDTFELLKSLVDLPSAVDNLGSTVGADLSPYALDDPMPYLPDSIALGSRQAVILERAYAEGMTLRELAVSTATTRGHNLVIGTASDIADRMQEWFEAGAADGFNVGPQTLPGGLADFVDLVVPELQRRGLFRTEYEGSTLRDRLGLPRPVNRHDAPGSR